MAKVKKLIRFVVSAALATIFIYAGVVKLLRPDEFLIDIGSYELVPYWIAYLAAFLIPAVEVIAGGMLLLSVFRREAAVVLLALSLLFIVALATAWARGLDISCGCFGDHAKANFPLLIGRDVLMALGFIYLFYAQPKTATHSSP